MSRYTIGGKQDINGANVISLDDNKDKDAYGRLRVSQNNILLSAQHLYDDIPLIFHNSSSGPGASASYDYDSSAVNITAGSVSGGICVRQSREYYIYRAEQGQDVALSFSNGQQEVNVRKRVGYFDANDGFYLEILENEVAFVIRSSVGGTVSEIRYPRSSWNLDRLDGTGSSKVTLDLTKSQIFVMDVQWMGTGHVHFGFDIDGILVHCHNASFSNASPISYTRTPSLPVRYEIENLDTTSVDSQLQHISSAVIREGGFEELAIVSAADTGFGTVTATTTRRSCLSIRLKDAFKRAVIRPLDFLVTNLGNEIVRATLILNPTLSGSLTWVDGNGPNGIFEKSTTQLAYTENSGHTMTTIFSPASVGTRGNLNISQVDSILAVNSDIDGNQDVLSLIVDSSSGTQSLVASIILNEFY